MSITEQPKQPEPQQHETDRLKKSFEVASVARIDIVGLRYHGRRITREMALTLTDTDMEHIAAKIGDTLTEFGSYWETLVDCSAAIFAQRAQEEEQKKQEG